MLARLPSLPRASRGAPMGYAVLPPPSLASGPQALLLSKLKAQINHAESTLLQVFFLKNLKPFEINTFEKQGEGSPLWLTSCYKKVSARKVRWNPSLPSSVLSSKLCRLQLLCLPLAGPERSRRIRKHPGVGLFFPFWNSSAEGSRQGFARSEISTCNRRSRLNRDFKSKIPTLSGLWTESSVQRGNFLPLLPPPMQIMHRNVQINVAALCLDANHQRFGIRAARQPRFVHVNFRRKHFEVKFLIVQQRN